MLDLFAYNHLLAYKAFRRTSTLVSFTVCRDGQSLGSGFTVPPGRCNSSHGGSCCACGGPLPLPHIHAHAPTKDHPNAGGVACSEACAGLWIKFQSVPHQAYETCPSHGKYLAFLLDESRAPLHT